MFRIKQIQIFKPIKVISIEVVIAVPDYIVNLL